MSEFSPSNSELSAEALLARARTQIYAEVDPFLRARMIAAAIATGDSTMGGLLPFAAYSAVGEDTGEDPRTYYPLAQKRQVGHELVEVLAGKRLFEEAHQLSLDLNRLDDQDGLMANCTLLKHGYPGPNGELFKIFSAEHMYIPPRAGRIRSDHMMDVEYYLEALTSYGINITGPGSQYQELHDTLAELEIDPWQRERRFSRFAVAAAQANNLPLAFQFKDSIADHTLKGTTLIALGHLVQDTAILEQLLPEIDSCRYKAATCQGQCGYRFCDPRANTAEIALGAVGLLARIGDTPRSRQLLRQYDDGFHFPDLLMRAYTELYEREGEMSDRQKILHFLNEISHYKSAYLSRFICKLVDADLKFGRILPTLVTDGETVPLVVWDVRRAYGHIDDFEKKLMQGGLPELAGLLDYDDHTMRLYDGRREKSKNATFATLAIALAAHGSAHSAEQLLGSIDDPIQIVRAKTGIAMQLLQPSGSG